MKEATMASTRWGGLEGRAGEGVDEACNTVPLLAVDLSARSIRWRKRRSREFHGDYHSNDSTIRSRPSARSLATQ